MAEKQISLDEIRRNIIGQEEFTYVIERKKKEGDKEVPDGNSVVIKMKALTGEERSVLENLLKSRIPEINKDFQKYTEEMRYLVLSRAITSISMLVAEGGKTEEVKVNIENKDAVEKFLRGLTYYTILALYTKYEDSSSQIFDDLKKKD